MKTRYFKNCAIIVLIGFVFGVQGNAQDFDLKKYRVRFNINTVKQEDNSRLIDAKFLATNKKDRKDRLPIFEADVDFYNVLEDEEIKLGSSKTNKEGIASITLPADQNYLKDENGFFTLKAVFEGTDVMDYEEDEVSVKDVFFELNLEEIDSVRTVLLNAYTLDSLQTKIPTDEIDVVFSVGGMISRMPIEEAYVEDGSYEFEYPNDIPGNTEGMVDVYVYLEDHDDYGNVIQKKTVNWGLVGEKKEVETHTLWSKVAPIWMYVVLTILIVGVWSNYIYSVVNLFRIRKEGKQFESEET
jgi:hypothetical protein